MKREQDGNVPGVGGWSIEGYSTHLGKGLKSMTMQISTAAVQQIDALTNAAEFIMCAVRALATGNEPDSHNVMDPLLWANEKLKEGMSTIKDLDALTNDNNGGT